MDTCALLWLAHDQKQLSGEALQMIETAPAAYISAISTYEISIKHQSGKLKLPCSPRKWLTGIVKQHDISVVPIDGDICIRATGLPMIHRDPCDRFIIATALIHELAVITADERFEDYGVRIYR